VARRLVAAFGTGSFTHKIAASGGMRSARSALIFGSYTTAPTLKDR
jgi:hypothetical protein